MKNQKTLFGFEQCGVIYEDHLQLAKFLNKNWENIGDWWFSKEVQNAINFFTSEYSLYEKRPVKEFVSKINKII